MGGLRQEDVEAFLHVTMVCHHADWNLTSRDDTPHKMKRDKLLHSVGTHPVEEHIRDACSDDATRCAEQHELRTPELCSSRRDMQEVDSVFTAGPRADFMTCSTTSSVFQRGVSCAPVRQETHFVICTLCWVCITPSASLSAVIWFAVADEVQVL